MRVGGIGTIEKRGENTWRIRLAVGRDPLTGKYQQKSRTIHGSKADAVRARDALRRELESGVDVKASKMTFHDFAEQFMAQRQMSGYVKDVTLTGERMVIRRLDRYLGGVALRELDVTCITRAEMKMLEDGFSQTMLHSTMKKLRQILKQAVRYDFIPCNPCDKLDLPRPSPRKMSALDATEARKLLDELSACEVRAMEGRGPRASNPMLERSRIMACRLAISTGMRRGEILGLVWKNVDEKNATIRIMQQFTTDCRVRAPKSRSGIRTISLDEPTLARLLEWRELQTRELARLRVVVDEETPVISNTLGGFQNPGDFSGWWSVFRKEVGFPELRFHDLRHTQATLLIGNGVDIKTVQSRLGHSRAATTLDTYACALPENDRKAANLLETLFSEDGENAENSQK